MKSSIRNVGFAFALLLTGCVSAPPGPPPEIQRLQDQLSRLHGDPRISPNTGPDLQNADAAVDVLARNRRRLDEPTFRHGVYIADRLIQIAEASGLARYEEQRGKDLGAERERLLAGSMGLRHETYPLARTTARDGLAHDELAAIQPRLSSLESHLDERGLVVALGDFMFENNDRRLRSSTTRALDTLVSALRDGPAAQLSIDGYAGSTDDRDLAARRAVSVRDYLVDRGVDGTLIDTRRTGIADEFAGNHRGRVEIVIRAAGR